MNGGKTYGDFYRPQSPAASAGAGRAAIFAIPGARNINDLNFGTRGRRDNRSPDKPVEIAPFWIGKFNRLGAWLFEYLWPWNALHMATALLYWFLVVPDIATMQSLGWGWGLWLLAVNSGGIFVLYGAVELFYYVKRKQKTRFKFNARFPSEHPSDVFWFNSRNLDNFLRSFLFGVPIWTLVEVLVLWAFANGIGNWIAWEGHWPWLVALTLLAPAIHEVHFFFIHRLVHTPFLHRHMHSVHLNSINPSPWTSLSMRPIEHLLHFSEMAWHMLIPSNPIIALFNMRVVGYGAINGHFGFEKLEITDVRALDSHACVHNLHHKSFEMNYAADGLVPLDKWMGTCHDGTKESVELLMARFRKEKERARMT
ncbi:MAG: sterol desaturase family protein [Albidovulum sp.]|nr:sterol desaturase family protein [Albidovulum sp.]